MWGWIKRLLPRQFLVVEVDKPRNPHELDPELRKSVETLHSHPGFLYLLAKLRYFRHAYEAELKSRPLSDLREVYMLQAAIFWSSWLEQTIRAESHALAESQASKPTADEKRLLDEAMHYIQEVGIDRPQA